MKKQLFTLMLAALPTFGLLASTDYESLYFSGKSPKLTAQEKAAMAAYQEWQSRSNKRNDKPIVSPDGTLRYIYGAQQATIICAPFKVCNLQLEPGEMLVGDPDVGDSARWTIKPKLAHKTINVTFKPHDVGLETSMVIVTDRRTYSIVAKSDRKRWMPKVAFFYPEQAKAKWDAIKAEQAREKEVETLPETREYLGDLDFDYAIQGSVSWMPVRVYNDGRKTIIEMPDTLHQMDAPALMVVTKKGGWFSDDQLAMVNYRMQSNRYIVDAVFDKAILIAGVGSDQQKVTIERDAP